MSNEADEEHKRGLAPKLRFPEFRDGPGWEARELGAMTTKVGSGITPTGGDKNYKTTGRPFVRSQNVGWGQLILDDVAFIDEETHASFDSTEIQSLDVLLNITGASIGRSAVADERIAGGNVNQHVCILRVKPNELNQIFLNQYLISQYGQKQIDSFQAGGNRQGLNFAQIRSFLIPLPPTEHEQKKIAACLSYIDDLITARTQKLQALKTHKKGLIQNLFPGEGKTTPALRFSEFENDGEWKIKPLSKIAKNLDSRRVPITEKDRIIGDVPYYGASGVIDYVQDYIFDEDLLCVSEDGANLLARVYPIAFSISGKTWVNNHAHVLKFDNFCTQVLVESYLNSISLEDYLTGMAQPKLNRAKLDTIPVPIPEIVEQQKIADCLSSLNCLIVAQEQKIEYLEAHKKGLLQQLFPALDEVGV